MHAGAVIVPAVLAAAEQEKLRGAAALLGIAVGVETICRLSLVVPKAVHKAGFHPTAVFGAMAAAAGVGAALRLDRQQLTNALGIAGSMASGIIEYLADGSWTKRMHPGWAAQSGLRAALLARAGFTGPRTVFEGTHGLFNAFAHTREGNCGALLDGFGERWLTETLAFKPYPCGTMVQPYIDCARRLRERGHRGRRYRRDGLRGRRGHRAPAVGAAGRQAAPAQRLRRPSSPRPTASPPPSCTATSASTPSPTRPLPTRPCARWPPRSATGSIPPTPTPTPTPATSARRSPTAAPSRSASRICAAGRRRRCRAPSWRRSSPSTPRAGGWRETQIEAAHGVGEVAVGRRLRRSCGLARVN